MLTEKQAWLRMARMWKKAKKDYDGLYCVVSYRYCGLCPTLNHLEFSAGILNSDVHDTMLKKIKSHKNYKQGRYIWPVATKRGINCRVNFCNKMAKKCS